MNASPKRAALEFATPISDQPGQREVMNPLGALFTHGIDTSGVPTMHCGVVGIGRTRNRRYGSSGDGSLYGNAAFGAER